MPPKVKDTSWAHCDMIDGKVICKYCEISIAGGGINKLKQHMVGIGGHVKPRGATNEVIGQNTFKSLRLKSLSQYRIL